MAMEFELTKTALFIKETLFVAKSTAMGKSITVKEIGKNSGTKVTGK